MRTFFYISKVLLNFSQHYSFRFYGFMPIHCLSQCDCNYHRHFYSLRPRSIHALYRCSPYQHHIQVYGHVCTDCHSQILQNICNKLFVAATSLRATQITNDVNQHRRRWVSLSDERSWNIIFNVPPKVCDVF